MTAKIEDALLQDIKKDIAGILKGSPFSAFTDATLYCVEEKTMQALRALRESFASVDRKNPFDGLCKLINTEKPAIEFKHRRARRYKLITDKNKVYLMIPQQLEIYKNRNKKRIDKALKNGEISEKQHDFAINELEQRIESAREKFEAIQKDLDSYDLVLTNYSFAKEYDEIYVYYGKSDGGAQYLRQTPAVNVLWYDPSRRASHREDAKIYGIVNTWNSLEGEGGVIFFQKRKKDG